MSTPIEIGSIVEGVVTGITHFGAFVALPNGQTGLVHISEIADTYVRDVRDHLKENDRVKVKVLSTDGRGRVGLSIRQAMGDGRPRERGGGGRRRFASTFEDKIKTFMKDSDERLTALRRSTESKRGGRGGGRRDG